MFLVALPEWVVYTKRFCWIQLDPNPGTGLERTGFFRVVIDGLRVFYALGGPTMYVIKQAERVLTDYEGRLSLLRPVRRSHTTRARPLALDSAPESQLAKG
jgi:hypothetical protein